MHNSIKVLLPATIAAATVVAPLDSDAADVFLKTVPAITGTATAKGHEGEIDILSWGWGLSNSAGLGAGGIEPGVIKLQPLSLVKNSDVSSGEFYRRIVDGSLLTEANLSINDIVGACGLRELMRVEMRNVAVTSNTAGFDVSLSSPPSEAMNLIFEKICILNRNYNASCFLTGTTMVSLNAITNAVESSTASSCSFP